MDRSFLYRVAPQIDEGQHIRRDQAKAMDGALKRAEAAVKEAKKGLADFKRIVRGFMTFDVTNPNAPNHKNAVALKAKLAAAEKSVASCAKDVAPVRAAWKRAKFN